MLTSFEGHAVPVDDEILNYLREHGIVEEGTSLDDLQKFLEHAVKADECHDLFVSLRRAAHADEGGKAKKKAKPTMTDRLPASSLRLGLPSGSLQASTIELFGRAGYRISIAGAQRLSAH